jgi:hypothetical protein
MILVSLRRIPVIAAVAWFLARPNRRENRQFFFVFAWRSPAKFNRYTVMH